MRALILAAGRGSRLGERGDLKPKCLTPLAGRTLLDWQISALANGGVEDIAIVSGYKHHALKGRADREFHNSRWNEGTMVDSMMVASSWVREQPCIISYGDVVYGREAVQSLKSCDASLAVAYSTQWRALWESRFEDPLSDAESFEIDDRGYVSDIGNRVSCIESIQGQYMGLFKVTPDGFDDLCRIYADHKAANSSDIDMTALFSQAIQSRVRVQAVPYSGLFLEVDTAKDLELYESRDLRAIA